MSDVVQCPYNKSHMIQKLKLQHHIIKCKKQHPNLVLQACPYNATHLMKKEELDDHIKCCPDNRFIEPWMYNLKRTIHGDLSTAPYHVDLNTADEEDWDLEYADSGVNSSC